VAPSVVNGSLLGHSHPVFDLGKDLFDRIEVGRVRRQEPQSCAGRVDDPADSCGLVGAEIVHDDDVAGPEGGQEDLLDIGSERRCVDRAVEDAGRGQAVAAQGPEEGHGAPVAMWGMAMQALAAWTPTPHRGHIGLDPGLVDEDQVLRVEPGLPALPALTPSGDVLSGLFQGEQGFF